MPDLQQLTSIYKKQILLGFDLLYIVQALLVAIGGYVMITNHDGSGTVYSIGKLAGQASALTFCVTILPGILNRFQLRSPYSSILMHYRRQLGISCYVFAITHLFLITIFPLINHTTTLSELLIPFELFGVIAAFLLLPLFLTSNNYSQRVLKATWYTLHRLVYIIVWVIFAHVALQEMGTMALILGIFAIAELASLLYKQYHQNRITV